MTDWKTELLSRMHQADIRRLADRLIDRVDDRSAFPRLLSDEAKRTGKASHLHVLAYLGAPGVTEVCDLVSAGRFSVGQAVPAIGKCERTLEVFEVVDARLPRTHLSGALLTRLAMDNLFAPRAKDAVLRLLESKDHRLRAYVISYLIGAVSKSDRDTFGWILETLSTVVVPRLEEELQQNDAVWDDLTNVYEAFADGRYIARLKRAIENTRPMHPDRRMRAISAFLRIFEIQGSESFDELRIAPVISRALDTIYRSGDSDEKCHVLDVIDSFGLHHLAMVDGWISAAREEGDSVILDYLEWRWHPPVGDYKWGFCRRGGLEGDGRDESLIGD